MHHTLKPELLRSHWEMTDCLCDEIFLGRHEDTLHGKEFLYEMFLFYASHDPRFHAVGWSRHAKGYMMYTDPDGREYRAEAAIAAFLGLPMKTEQVIINHRGKRIVYLAWAAGAALSMIFRQHADIADFHDWLRWHVQKQRGYTHKGRELDHGYPTGGPRKFPDTLRIINDLYPEKD